MTLYGRNNESLWMNVPVSADTIETIIHSAGLHVGHINDGQIADIVYVPIVISTAFDINAERKIPSPRISAVLFELFMKECKTGQALHRDYKNNDSMDSGILDDLSPSVLKFAPSLAQQKKFELANQYTPSFMPTLGLGIDGTSTQMPAATLYNKIIEQSKTSPTTDRTIIINPNQSPSDHNPMSFFTKTALEEKARTQQDLLIEQAHNTLEKDLDKILKPINALIGMEPLKEKISSIAYLTQAKALRTINNLPNTAFSLNMVFTGPPGTGKTTAGKLIGKIMKELGYLKSSHVVETRPAEIWGRGFQDLFEEADGGVLFIDEAYSLTSSTTIMTTGRPY